MSGSSQVGLWVLALGGSLALHGAVAMALVALPAPEVEKPAPTQISIESLPTGSVETLDAALAVTAVSVDRAAPVAPPSLEPLAPVKDAAASAEAVAPSTAVPVIDAAQAVGIAAMQETQAVSDTTSVAATLDAPETLESAVAESVAPAVDTQAMPAATAPDPPAIATPTDSPTELRPMAAEAVAPADIQPDVVLAAPVAQTAPSLPTASDGTVIASVVEAAPVRTVAPSAEVPATTQGAPAVVAPAVPASPVVTAAPVAVAPTVEGMSPSAVVVAVTTDTGATAIAPVEEDADADAAPGPVPAGGGEQVAMVVPDDVTIAPSAPKPKNVPLADFLKSWEGDECILAIPTESSAVEALSDTNASASALSEAYRRVSGVPVSVSHSRITKAQCATLSFSRSIAQYPNYPLRLDLDQREIASGGTLSGRVSGLRKNTLYLFVVDDEGKAKLITQISGITKLTAAFSEPLTLTGGAASAVQLLVAIASDGPLRTVPTRPGIVADAFFESLGNEIRDDQRPILYGITSFVVR